MDESFFKNYKSIMCTLGVECSAIYGILVDFYEYAKRDKTLTKDNCFYLTIPTVEKLTLLKKSRQLKAIRLLEENGYIKVSYRGMPKKRYFSLLSWTKIGQLVGRKSSDKWDENRPTCEPKTGQLVGRKSSDHGTKIGHNKEHNTKNINKEHNTKNIINKNNVVVKTYQQAFGVINGVLYQTINDDIKTYTEQWTLEALNIAIKNNVRSWNYTKKILVSWAEKYPTNSKPWEEEKIASSKRNTNTVKTGGGEKWRQAENRQIDEWLQ